MTQFIFKASEIKLNSSFSNGKHTESITANVSIDDDLRLEIGEKNLIASKRKFLEFKDNKTEVELHLSIKKASEYKSLVADFKNRHRGKEKSLGTAQLFDEYFSEASFESYPSALYFRVYLSDDMYEKIYSNIANKLIIAHIRVEGEAALGEINDAALFKSSHQIWQPISKPYQLALYNFDISFSQAETGSTELVKEQKILQNTLVSRLFYSLSKMQFALYVIAAAAAMEIVKRLIGY
jgi:hypothetical protein